MMKFGNVTGYDQLVLSNTTGCDELGSASCETNKWMKQRREQFHSDIPKILVTKRHLFAAYQNALIILDTNPISDVCEGVFLTRKEFRLDSHSSPISCFGFDEETLLLCSCSDEHVLLSKWDSLLGHWDTKAISENDGRILSCSISFKGLAIYLALFKSDTLLVYKVVSAHHPTERGPLILDSIEYFASLEKVKELTSWSKSLFVQNKLNVVGVASGNTVSIKLWQITSNQDENQIKLMNHRMVSNMKTTVGADLIYDNDTWFVIIVGSDGVAEVFSVSEDNLNMLYHFKIEDPLEASAQMALGTNNNNNNSLNTTMSGMQMDSRFLCACFFPVTFPEPSADASKNSSGYMGGDGDAKICAPFHELEKLGDAEKESIFGKDPLERNVGSTLCPKLLIAVTTTKGVSIMDVVSGQLEMSISFGELLKDETILIQYAQMCVNADTNEIVLGLQSCLTRIVFSRRFTVTFDSPSDEMKSFRTECASLIPSQPLSSKSVLRKKIRSPPRQPIVYPNIKCSKVGLSRSPGTTPAWARSRSRPQPRLSTSRTKLAHPLSARSQSSQASGSSRSLLNIDSESLTARITNIPTNGTYESENLPIEGFQRLSLSSSFSHGMSTLRIASTNSGKHLAFGGNLSPLVITKTRPFQNYRIYKNVGKISNIQYNFAGNLLLIASSDCRTTIVDWQNSKELLSFEFSTKFNEHVHSQFYFMDKFIAQPEENKLVLYSYAKRDNGYIKLKAGEFQLSGQAVTAMGAVNQFYSNMIITGLSNKSIQLFDTNAETVSVTIPYAHSKPISCIRLNEAPKGQLANSLCDIFMTSSFSSVDPIRLWDIRSAKCILRISDVNQATFVPTSRPNMSPCGRYIVSGFEDCSVNFYDIRRVTNRLHSFKKLGSTVLDCLFDTNFPMVWSGCRNGSIMNFHIP